MHLTKTTTNNKTARYLYTVVDDDGTILATRRSNRDYVAATIDGEFFFGRTDLIGKGAHGDAMKRAKTPMLIAHLKQ